MSETGEVELDLHQTPPFLQRFGLDNEADERAVKRAYARELKGIDQEQDPEGFQALREARDLSLRWLVYRVQRLAWEAQQAGESEAGQQAQQGQEPQAKREPAAEAVGENATGGGTVPPPVQAQAVQALAEPGGEAATGPAADTAGTSPDELEAVALAPETLGAAVFGEFAQALDRQLLSPSQLEQMFERHLADDRLVAVDAKDIFEWQLAQRLASGWRPGHETLIELASKTFGWNADRRRLLRFGRVGEVLDATMHELAAFEQQDVATRKELMDVIRSLRLYKAPDTQHPPERMMRAEVLAGRFPYLVGIITSSENLEAWRKTPAAEELKRRLQKQEERENRQIGSTRPAQAQRAKKEEGVGSWGWGVFALFMLFTVAINLAKNDPPRPTVGYGPPSPAIRQLAEEQSQRAKALVQNAADQAELETLFGTKPTQARCGLTSDLAARNPGRDNVLGERLEQELDRLIVACGKARMWPSDPHSKSIVAQAQGREQMRLTRLRQMAQEEKALKGAAKPAPYQTRAESEAMQRMREQSPRSDPERRAASEAGGTRPSAGTASAGGTQGEANRKLLEQIQKIQPDLKKAPPAAPAPVPEESAASALTAGAVNAGGATQALPASRGTGTQPVLDTPRGRRGDPWYQSEVDRSRERLDPPGSRPPARPYGWEGSTPPRGTSDQ